MVTNKLFLLDGKHYLVHAGDVYKAEDRKHLSWINWSVGYVLHHGTVVGNNFKLKKAVF